MSEKNILKEKLVSLVLPVTLQQFMLAVISASDAVMLGAKSQSAMGAVSLAGQVRFIFNLFLSAITIGTSMFAAQYWGKGDKPAIERITGVSYFVTLPVSLLFTVFTLAMPAQLMRILTNEPLLVEYGAKYLRTVSFSYICCGISQVYLCVMKNSGRAVKGSIIGSVCVVLNIALNALLIYGFAGLPALGIAGAALATVIAGFVEALWALSDGTKAGRIKIKARYCIRPDKTALKEFWKYTLPVLGNEFVWGVGFTMGTIIIGRMGADAIAANSVATITKNLVVCFCLGLGSGGGVLIGNELGEGNFKRAKEYGDALCRISVLSGVIAGIVLLLLNPLIRTFANLTPTANEYLKYMLFVCAYYVIGKSINCTTIGGIFCAGGDGKFGLLCDAITLWVIVIPCSLIAAFALKLPTMAVYVIINLDEIIKLPAVYKRYKKYRWVKDLTRKGESL